jgi:hypothetical protein
MSRFRYSIASLLGLVLFVAVAFAALRQADELWDSAIFSLTVGLLLISVLLAVHRTGRSRAFWLGFAVVGWAYLIVSLIPPVESRLVTKKGLSYLDSKIPGRDASPKFAVSLLTEKPSPGSWKPSATSEDLVRIGHSLLALVLAFVGGQLSRRLFDRERAGQPGGSTVPAPTPISPTPGRTRPKLGFAHPSGKTGSRVRVFGGGRR